MNNTLLSLVAILALGMSATPAKAQQPASMDRPAHNEAAIAGFGGYAGLLKINLDLVARLKANPRIGTLFKETDAQHLATQLSDQFCELLGGGCKYVGSDMKAAHQGMGIRTHHFNALAEELQRAMDAAGVAQTDQFRLIGKLAPMKRDIIETAAE